MPTFNTLDTSHWKTTDKAWVQEREQQWPEIEKLLALLHKNKKARSIIKQYFLKGKLPDWKALADWGPRDGERHLDLMLFLYLHPSKDDAVLRPLRDRFMDNRDALVQDRLIGFQQMRFLAICACSGGTVMAYLSELENQLPPDVVASLPQAPEPEAHKKILVMHTEGNNERLFRLMWPDATQLTARLPVTKATQHYLRLEKGMGVEELPLLPVMHELSNLYLMGDWLKLPPDLNAGARDMLYQYEHPLDVWYHQCAHQEVPDDAARRELLMIAVYRAYHFDVHKEGSDSPRTRFVQRILAIFQQRAFSASFKGLLTLVQRGDAVVHDPWGFEPKVLAPALYTHNPVQE